MSDYAVIYEQAEDGRWGAYLLGPQALALGVHDPGVAELLEVVRERRLRDVEQWHELADADLPACFRSTSTSCRRMGSPSAFVCTPLL
jgi:hypothetical protein